MAYLPMNFVKGNGPAEAATLYFAIVDAALKVLIKRQSGRALRKRTAKQLRRLLPKLVRPSASKSALSRWHQLKLMQARAMIICPEPNEAEVPSSAAAISRKKLRGTVTRGLVGCLS